MGLPLSRALSIINNDLRADGELGRAPSLSGTAFSDVSPSGGVLDLSGTAVDVATFASYSSTDEYEILLPTPTIVGQTIIVRYYGRASTVSVSSDGVDVPLNIDLAEPGDYDIFRVIKSGPGSNAHWLQTDQHRQDYAVSLVRATATSSPYTVIGTGNQNLILVQNNGPFSIILPSGGKIGTTIVFRMVGTGGQVSYTNTNASFIIGGNANSDWDELIFDGDAWYIYRYVHA